MKCTNYVVHNDLEKSLAVGVSPGECGTEMKAIGVVNGFGTTVYQCPNCKTIAIE